MIDDPHLERAIGELVSAWRRLLPPAQPGPPLPMLVLYRDGKPLVMAPSRADLLQVCMQGDGASRMQASTRLPLIFCELERWR